jgi:protoporphyrinogen oxidase
MSVAILGSGISGLTAGFYAQCRAELFEASHRCGGWIHSDPWQHVLLESGPRSLRPHPVTLSLVRCVRIDLRLNH